jgi:hypothetical protein
MTIPPIIRLWNLRLKALDHKALELHPNVNCTFARKTMFKIVTKSGPLCVFAFVVQVRLRINKRGEKKKIA